MVRDDFWVSLTRFMGDLGIEILQGQNTALVDLFDPIHARKVLAEFGRSYGRLSDDHGKLSKEQDLFLNQAVQELAQDGRVISIRLALFAEMVKGRPWSPATLKEVGGTEGVGVAFLEETFASAALRSHQTAAQAVLKKLLPVTGTDIKGQMRSQEELRAGVGVRRTPREFGDLLHILDNDFRLITPTDPESSTGGRPPASPKGERYFQLTHDYLVHSLRDWLTRKQRETRRGRAELRLAERSSLWNAKPENRHLPSVLEWANIRLLTKKKDWTESQRRDDEPGRAASWAAYAGRGCGSGYPRTARARHPPSSGRGQPRSGCHRACGSSRQGEHRPGPEHREVDGGIPPLGRSRPTSSGRAILGTQFREAPRRSRPATGG